MKIYYKRAIALILCLSIALSLAACTGENLVKKALESIAENEKIQTWLEENDIASLSESAISKFKESIPALKEFLAREDVKEKFETIGLPLIKEYLGYKVETMRLKAETLGKIIMIFAPELTQQVEDIFATAETSAP